MKTKLTINIYHITFVAILLTMTACKKEERTLNNLQIKSLDSIATIDVPNNAPGVAVGIVMDGNIVYEKYAGYADLKDSTFIDYESRFNIASNGKQFTALAILSLIEEGKVTLNDDIRTFFPKLFPKVESNITIAHLLNHTSGIRDVYDLWGLKGITWWEHTYDNDDVLNLLRKQNDLNFEPGSKYSYSNSNYMVLAEIVEKASGSNFIDYTNQMFQDLNMPNTSFTGNYKTIDGPIAKPYLNFDTWFGYDWIWNAYGDGNIFSTLQDQLEFEKILQTKKNKRFSKELLEQSQSLLPNSKNKKYGYGVEFMKHQKIPYKYHGGSTGAWKAITARFEKQNFSIVTLTNSGKTDPMTQTLNSANVLMNLKADSEDIRLTPEKVGPYVSIKDVVGVYEINGYIWELEERNGDLYLLRSGRNDMKLIREADNIFQQWNDAPFKQEFTKNEKGEMQVSAYYPNTPNFTMTRKDIDLKGFDYKAINGSFLNEETGVSFSVKYDAGLNYEITNGENKMKAIILSRDELVINDYDYRIRVEKNKDNLVSDIFLTSGRIQNVRFSRIK
ncbi:serine hydrolase domain-containing protein [Winogradskyella jejuensis]|uniref:CubicO group peptidase, beta-lactamase class C family n=1 Tax=Winogradskyella jejuensis TaxID=1089305 RepID=A0A1M5M9B0_9FLAO|nr:serine hydrolase domain-containing protein [Winogradskyella jejuensis]SHG73838.1 CubicO group peptidase, beta-lactamase class C family [Winogradskyella jejuensis]